MITEIKRFLDVICTTSLRQGIAKSCHFLEFSVKQAMVVNAKPLLQNMIPRNTSPSAPFLLAVAYNY